MTPREPAAAPLLALLGTLSALNGGMPSAPSATPSSRPAFYLWAWERPEDLRFIDPRKTGIAFLAVTIRLQGNDVEIIPRRQPLRVPEGAEVLAVARIEGSSLMVERGAEGTQRVLDALLSVSRLEGVRGLQIDFDAVESQRPFYRRLLSAVRRQQPVGRLLSITALASWCLGDPWLKDLPIDEAVPMLFRLGRDQGSLRRLLGEGRDFSLPVCRTSYGVSVDEPIPPLKRGRRVYAFNPNPWTSRAAGRLRDGVLP